MSASQIVVLVISLLVMFAGVIGSALPVLPGPPLVLLGALIFAIFTKFAIVGWKILLALALLTLVAEVLDHLFSLVGARKFGASKMGIWFGILGLIIGFFFMPWGLVIGPIVGVVIGEAIAKRRALPALRAGAGSVVGLFVAVVVKFLVCLVMIGIFVMALVHSL
jgi:hypothetical protein